MLKILQLRLGLIFISAVAYLSAREGERADVQNKHEVLLTVTTALPQGAKAFIDSATINKINTSSTGSVARQVPFKATHYGTA